MPYKVICYSHRPTKSWGPFNSRTEALKIINNHPQSHKIEYYKVASLSAVKVGVKSFLHRIKTWNPPILEEE